MKKAQNMPYQSRTLGAEAWYRFKKNKLALCCPLTGVTTLAGVTRLVFRAPAGFSVGVSLGMVQDTIGISLCCSGSAVCLFSMQPMSA